MFCCGPWLLACFLNSIRRKISLAWRQKSLQSLSVLQIVLTAFQVFDERKSKSSMLACSERDATEARIAWIAVKLRYLAKAYRLINSEVE